MKAEAVTIMERRTICFPRQGTRTIMQDGDPDFPSEIARLYRTAENNALEALVTLKRDLQTLPTGDFWSAVTEGMSKILGAEMSFVMKRVLVDDQEAPVEMPPLGEPGSCMMAAAFHYCTNDGSRNTIKQSKFAAYGCPCAYMRHDKVFLIPDKLNEFITDNPNKLPTPAEAYIGMPLFAEGKCFAHFGVMWSKEGAAQRTLSWAFIEMLLHALEDMIGQRFLEGANFMRPSPAPRERQRVIPHDAVTIAQSLRPYAGSLSHELRTPMQGVVGMLDVMYATVQEAVETSADAKLRQIFEELKTNIEVVQDSSRRAVEAADNVVHAYDMNMSIPEGPPGISIDDSVDTTSPHPGTAPDKRPDILIAGHNLPLARKRRRDEAFSRTGSNASSASKYQRVETAASTWVRETEPSQEMRDGLHEAEHVRAHASIEPGDDESVSPKDHVSTCGHAHSSRNIAPGLRHADLREMIQYIINEGLKVGGRPDSAIAQVTEDGEVIEVRTRGSDGIASTKVIDWSVDPNVPRTMYIDEKDLTKLISCVFLNAIKFTSKDDGRVDIHARLSSRGKYVSIKISDNGPGIPTAFLPKLFKPFSQENGSLTRQSEGLGLGLMVAKGIARKLGGDLMCTRAETSGSRHGTEFEIKVPLMAGETISRPSSPFGSPMPRLGRPSSPGAQPASPQGPSASAAPASPRMLTRALHEAVSVAPLSCSDLPGMCSPGTPPSPRTHLTPPSQRAKSATSSPLTPTNDHDFEQRPKFRKTVSNPVVDRELSTKYPLNFLVAEDNKINRKLLVSMLAKFGYKTVYEAHDGAEAVRQMKMSRPRHAQIDVVLMDLWMPLMDGYEATQRILEMDFAGEDDESVEENSVRRPTVLAVTADVTDGALERAYHCGMTGYMTKPYKMVDLQRLILEYCARQSALLEGDGRQDHPGLREPRMV
ncbi:histidine kinase [Teratosphaeria destructans]|uniref:histidine kinase n=1 Tax=Teratosphaeria destructans TaxID=418781 RepID=A0A9W7SZN5_9PEZI|nr:histidine kinase [Teratosphaeria destructans]